VTRFRSLLLALLMLPMALQAQTPAADAHYIELKPPFVGTIGPGPRIQYLKVDVALRAEDAAAAARIQHHDALIRNALVGLFARQTPEGLASLEGKEQLRADALARVREVLEQEEDRPLVADLLFTNLITQ
jgi:flagellar protein FliL